MKRPIHESEVDWEIWDAGGPQELRAKALCDIGGAAKVGVGLLELAPGSDTRPSHYHSDEEEHLFVIAGRATLFLGDGRFELTAGSYVCFPAGQPLLHHLQNTGPEPFRYLMIGERIPTDRVTHEES